MENLKSAAVPRIQRGRLIWCEGDVFTYRIRITLTSLGAAFPDHTGYTYVAEFFDKSGKDVCVITQEGGESRTFTIDFDEDTTALFPRGRYSYDVRVLCPDGTRISCGNDLPATVL